MGGLVALGSLSPGDVFETEGGERGVKMAQVNRLSLQWVRLGDGVHMYGSESLRVRHLSGVQPAGPTPGCRDEVMALIRRAIEGLNPQAVARAVWDFPVSSGTTSPELNDAFQQAFAPAGRTLAFNDQLRRLLWLLGLSDGERAFVTALADRPDDADTWKVYRDWLLDQGRDGHAEEMDR